MHLQGMRKKLVEAGYCIGYEKSLSYSYKYDLNTYEKVFAEMRDKAPGVKITIIIMEETVSRRLISSHHGVILLCILFPVKTVHYNAVVKRLCFSNL